MRLTHLLLAVLAVATPRLVRGDEPASRLGTTATWGGGVSRFINQDMTSASTWGVTWGAHVTLGTRRWLALDTAFLGSSTALEGSVVRGGNLDLYTMEAALRLNARPLARWTPYAFAGLGVQKAKLSAVVMATPPADMRTYDYSLTVPMGVGFHVRLGIGVILDLRGTYRANRGPGLVPNATGRISPIDAWEAVGGVGFEL